MGKFDTMNYIICAAVLCYDIYLTVQNVRLLLANEKVRREYLNKHKDGYTMANQYLPYMTFFLGSSMIGVIGTFVVEKNTKDELYVCSALALVAIISAGIAFDPIVKRWVIVDDDGFVYEGAHYRFCSVLSMDPMKSVIKNIDILTTEYRHVAVFEKTGAYLHECSLAWKERKKNENK